MLLLKARMDGRFPMNPLRVIGTIRKVAGKNDIVISDAGKHKMQTGWYYHVNKPSTAVVFNGLAPMGGAIPGAIGARLAAPSRDVIVICGDGGFIMCNNEIY